jgi:hypothetical protein
MKKSCFFVLVFLTVLSKAIWAQAPVISPISGPANLCSNGPLPVSFSVTAGNSPSNYVWSISSGTLMTVVNGFPGGSVFMVYFPNTNASYTLFCSAINASGSSPTMSFVINVFEKPNVTFSGNTAFCQGSSTSISASATQASPTQGSSTLLYTWSPPTGLNTTTGPNVIANPILTTNYTVTVANGPCTSTASILILVSQPNLNVTSSNPTICEGEFVLFTATGATSYQWNTGSTSDTVWVNPPVSTSYTVTGIDTNGCSANFVIYQPVDVCTGVKGQAADLSGSAIYPNPSSGLLTIDPGESGNEAIKLEIMDALGRVVLTDEVRQTTVLNLAQLSKGIYIVVLRQNTAVKTLKLIKE